MIHDETLIDLGEYIKEELNDQVESFVVKNKELSLNIKRDGLNKTMLFLRDNGECLFSTLVNICGVDYPSRKERFEIVYNLLSIRHNNRIRVKLTTTEDISIDSLEPVFASAGWMEREIWDMYGVKFNDHPDLRRILTDYGFEGHPLRKDFPLTGYQEIRYDENKKRIIYENVKLEQEYRNFDNLSPWNGDNSIDISDKEKAKG